MQTQQTRGSAYDAVLGALGLKNITQAGLERLFIDLQTEHTQRLEDELLGSKTA